MIAKLQDLGKENMIIFLKSSLVIFDPKALVSNHLLCISIIKSLKSVQSEYVTFCYDLAKRLSHYLYFFSFLFLFLWTYNYKVERGKVSRDFVTMV